MCICYTEGANCCNSNFRQRVEILGGLINCYLHECRVCARVIIMW